MKLVYQKTGIEVKEGDMTTTCHGQRVYVRSITKPTGTTLHGSIHLCSTAASTGYPSSVGECDPSVIGAKWI